MLGLHRRRWAGRLIETPGRRTIRCAGWWTRSYREEARTLRCRCPANGAGREHVAVGHRIAGTGRPGRRPHRDQGDGGAARAALPGRSVARALPAGPDGGGGGARDPQSAPDDQARTRAPARRARSAHGGDRGARADGAGGDPAAATRGQRLPEGGAPATASRLAPLRPGRAAGGGPPRARSGGEPGRARPGAWPVGGCLPIVGDREVLRQALQNLVPNAVQALPSREGRVALRGARVGTTSVLVGGGQRARASRRKTGRRSSTSTSRPRKGAPASGWRWCGRRWRCTGRGHARLRAGSAAPP